MGRFISVRSKGVGGPVVPAFGLSSDDGETWRMVADEEMAAAASDRDVIIAIHGFNVSRKSGTRSYNALEAALQLEPDQAFFGVLWPGDFFLPVVNYPAEAGDAVQSGRYVAEFVDRVMPRANSISFISHSLGGRVLLEAVQRLGRRARQVCITAGAVDSDCLKAQYLAAKENAERVSVLASSKDKVLRLAYPAGDFFSDLLWRDKDSPWRGALGLKGPNPFEPRPRVNHRQIDPGLGYDHGNYFPPGDAAPGKWQLSVAYMRRAVNSAPDTWP